MKRLAIAGLALSLGAMGLAACVPQRYLEQQGAAAPQAASSASSVVVQRGDSLSAIARREGVSTRTLAEANALRAPYVIRPGQRLVVPRAAPVASAAPAGAPAAAAVPPSGSRGGEVLIRPSDRVERQALPPPPAAPAQATPAEAPRAATARSPAAPRVAEPARAAAPPSAPAAASEEPPPRQEASATPDRAADDATPPARSSRLFRWPVQGRIVSDFGPKPGGLHNDGINIAAARGTAVHAAENGVVVYAGNELRGFGNLLLVRHADGWVTAYGHLDQMLVRRGQQVRRGQAIGRVGSTGNVRTPQLHFEVRRGTRPVNPSDFLEQ